MEASKRSAALKVMRLFAKEKMIDPRIESRKDIRRARTRKRLISTTASPNFNQTTGGEEGIQAWREQGGERNSGKKVGWIPPTKTGPPGQKLWRDKEATFQRTERIKRKHYGVCTLRTYKTTGKGYDDESIRNFIWVSKHHTVITTTKRGQTNFSEKGDQEMSTSE